MNTDYEEMFELAPVSVTTASSSMRMPMFHYASGTPSAGRT